MGVRVGLGLALSKVGLGSLVHEVEVPLGHKGLVVRLSGSGGTVG